MKASKMVYVLGVYIMFFCAHLACIYTGPREDAPSDGNQTKRKKEARNTYIEPIRNVDTYKYVVNKHMYTGPREDGRTAGNRQKKR